MFNTFFIFSYKMVKKTNKQRKTGQKRRTLKGGSGILTYALNGYETDTQLDDANITSRQMYNEQNDMNPRVLGGSRRRSRKTRKSKLSKK